MYVSYNICILFLELECRRAQNSDEVWPSGCLKARGKPRRGPPSKYDNFMKFFLKSNLMKLL